MLPFFLLADLLILIGQAVFIVLAHRRWMATIRIALRLIDEQQETIAAVSRALDELGSCAEERHIRAAVAKTFVRTSPLN